MVGNIFYNSWDKFSCSALEFSGNETLRSDTSLQRKKIYLRDS
jgi:hypothetical protein